MNVNMILKLGAGALIVGTAITWAGCSKSGASNNLAGAATAPPAHQNDEDKMPRVNIQAARDLVAEGKAVIIGVRGDEAFKTSHIKGAIHIPLDKIASGDYYKELPKDKLIIAYCS